MINKSHNSLRLLSFKKSFLPHAEGSCLVKMGQTQVLCVATVEEKAPPHAIEKGIGWVSAEYAMLPRSGQQRSSRQKCSTGGRAQEISRLVGRSLRSAVDLKLLGNRTITIDCDVIRADGGTRTASINGGFVALHLAIQKIFKAGLISEWPIRDFIGAVSVGLYKNKVFLDMSYNEDKDAQADVNVVMTSHGELIEVQGTAEEKPFSMKQFEQMIDLAKKGISQITKEQKKVLGVKK
ncbi:MAG: ribonuclease PH [Elusimicrobiota bacterium]